MDNKYTLNGSLSDISAMLVSTVRYALGRRTYIVEWTCNFIKNNTHVLTKNDMQVMIYDIESQEKYGYGDECDKKSWLSLLEFLKNLKEE